MAKRIPILLSFNGISHQNRNLIFGQLTHTRISDLSFRDYSRRKTFKTLFRLYRTRPYRNQQLTLVFDAGEVKATTNAHGAFYEKPVGDFSNAVLKKVLLSSGEDVKLVDGLYDTIIRNVSSDTVVVSDIDDTLLHSFIYRKLKKLRTMMFTAVENRKAVDHMQQVMKHFSLQGASPIYLSNSEQNLYPMIYRFLIHNKFPTGPLFLKQLRSLWDLMLNVKFPVKNTHKISTLEDLMMLLPDKKFVLMGDNTQHDLQIYLSLVDKFGDRISSIVIRKVIESKHDNALIEKSSDTLKQHHIQLYYTDSLPTPFQIIS
ncbi:MAG TPA: App1 family protein [Chryseosolibacter sp.]|nr:App1 family protein [Chryseosolibacter sp.]